MSKPKQITMDYQEYLDDQAELQALRKPANGQELSEAEHQEATGILVVRALQNPELIRRATGSIDLGKYKAIFVTATTDSSNHLRVKFVRD